MYKVLANLLSNGLKVVMRKIISKTQTTCVKERQILDGILITNKMVNDRNIKKNNNILF